MIRKLLVLAIASAALLPAAKYNVTDPGEIVNSPRSSNATTALLFAFTTSEDGFDTEVTLSNTSLDTFGSASGSGACTLYYYGSGAPSNPQTSVSIPAGHQIVFDISTGGSGVGAAPNFGGYIVANCAFPLARGLAKLFPSVGTGGFAVSQDAQVLTLPRSTSNTQYLLFPFLTNKNGYDSGIALANTSMDPFGTTPSTGSCTLTFYGANAPSPLTGISVPPGTLYAAVASQIAPNFQGYAIASCNFPDLAGFGFVSDVGARNVGYSENPELITSSAPRSAAPSALLFTSVSAQTGNDTAVFIANTSLDVFGTASGSGACTLTFSGSSAPSPVTTSTLTPGSVYGTLLSQIAPGFLGYVAVSCPFPQARGFAQEAAAGFATSYNSVQAEVVTLPRNSTPTGLLFPAVTNVNGNDTEIDIANTSADPFGTSPASGTCTISYFGTVGGGGPPSPQVSTSIPAGAHLVFSLSQGTPSQGIAATPGFAGYITANCGFPVARGLASIQQGGPILSIASTHNGNFIQGQTGATYTLTVSNQTGAEATSGTTTVTETVPSGLTLVSMSGTGWTCPASGTTCTSTAPLAGGGTYPSITVTVNVAASATSPQVNSVSVAATNALTANATDSTTIDVQATGAITEYPVPTAGATPVGITAGPDGALWFAESAFTANKIGRITTLGAVTEFPTPSAGSEPIGIVLGPDGALWFTEQNVGKIGRITTGGVFTEYALPSNASVPLGVTAGPDGALWFVEKLGNKIGRITTSGSITEYPVPTAASSPYSIATGPDGALWFTELTGGNIGRITSAGSITEYPIPTVGGEQIAAGPDGALWFTDADGNKIGRITTAGAFTEYSIPTANAEPFGIAPGPDGALWFVEYSGNNIGRITTAGAITEYPIPTAGSGPGRITAGPDGAMWFTEENGNKIGRISTGNFGTPSLSITNTNSGAFTQGQQGAYTLTVSNAAGAGATTSPVLVTETLPAALSLVSMSGTGWACTVATASCTRSDPLSPGASYLAITVTVNVAFSATSPQVNTASVSGGGSATSSATDSTVINPAPVLSIVSTHIGNFTQTELGATYTLTVSNAAGAAPTTGIVTVTETIPAGLTLVAMSGGGWSCTGSACNRSDTLSAGASYPAITVTVNVAANATSPLVNSVMVSGGGSASATATDSTVINPLTTGASWAYPVPTLSSSPFGITTGPDGALWFTEDAAGKIGRITTSGSITEYPTPSGANSIPEVITTGPDGALWFAEGGPGKIGRITTAGAFTEYSLSNSGAAPLGIATGPDGALWFTERAGNNIGRITTSGSITEYPVPTAGAQLEIIAAGPDGALWFTERLGNKVGRISTSGSITEYPIPTAGGAPNGIAAGPDGALWFTELGGNKIGRITTAGAITEYTIPAAATGPYQIAVGPDDALWFTQGNGTIGIARVTTAGVFTQYNVPAGVLAGGITAGPDGAVWFTEQNGNAIGRIYIGLTSTPTLSILSSHFGVFALGEQNATYTLTVSNAAGAGATTSPVLVIETLPAALSLVSMSGTGWACTVATASCTRSDPLSPGASYQPITVTVNVAANATSPQVNNVSVSGGGSATAVATDSTIVATSLSIVCTPSQISFTYTIGGTQPAPQSCSVTSSPSGLPVIPPPSTVSGGNWLNAPAASDTPATLTISVDTVGLAAGTYTGGITVLGIGSAVVIPVSLTVNPSAQVTFALAPTSASVPATAGTGTAALTLVPSNSNTAWTAASTATWLHLTTPASGAGAASIGYSVDANTGAERIGTFNVSSGGDVVATFTLDQAAASCSALTVSPTSFTFGSGGGTGVLTFDTAGCPWTVSTSDGTLITGLPTGGSAGTITFGVFPGTTAKSATITIGTTPPTTVTVTRSAPVCTYTIATHGAIGASQSFIAPGGTGSVDVSAPAGCTWTASANTAFLSVTSGASGSGAGSVSYSVASNPSTTASRTGTLTVAGTAFTINQIALGPQTYNCTTNTGVPPVVRGEGIAELTGDLLVTCSGFSSGGVTGDVLVTLNTSLTNHTLTADPSGQTTDALLLMDEPSSASLKLSGAGQNVYRGTIAGPLAVRFKNVSLAPETGSFSHVFRIANVRVDVSRAALPGPVTAAVAILSVAPFGAVNPQTVGLASVGSSSFAVGTPVPAPTGESLPVTFAETFPTAYRTRLASGQDPSAVGVVYNSESGYVNSAVLGSDTGFATNATRLVVRFANIPAGTLVYAPVAQASGSATAVLVSADSNGTGGSPMQGSAQVAGYQPVALINGAGTATWEITASNPSAFDTVSFNLLFSNPSLTLQNSCAAGTAPSICGALGPQVAVGEPSNTAPAPRFVNPSVVTSSQVTRLSIAPNPAGAQSSSTTPKKPQADLAVRRATAAIPQTSGSSNVVSVGGTVTIGEILQSDVNSPVVSGACVGTTLPPSYTITACSADNGGACTPTGGNSISTCYPTFDPGQSSNINVTADTTDSSDAPAELDSNATSNSGNFGAGSFSQILAVSPGASITLSFQGPSGIPAGQAITYTVSLNNRGAAKLAGDPMIVTIALDPSLTGVVAPVPGVGDAAWACKQTGVTLVCTNTSAVAANGQSSFEVSGTVSLSAAGNIISTSGTLTLGGQASAAQPVNTSVGKPPAPATLLSPAYGATGVSTPVSLTWGAATGAASYDVYLGTSSPPPLVFSTTSLTYTTGSLTSGTYYWQVNAKYSFGAVASAVWSFTVGSLPGYRFVQVTPCRIMDTRGATGTFGGPSIAGGATRSVPIPQSACNIPSTAQAYSLNITVVPPGPLNYLSIWPTGQSQPVVSTLNSLDGRIVANAAIVPAGTNGAISLFVSNTTDVIIDINGYFAPASTAGSMSFYTATPCRIVDTRSANGAFGSPFLSGGSTRSFTIPSSSCGIPATAQAYSLNMTVVPHGALGYLTTWPTGQPQPLVSTLNSADGSIVANAAIVPAGTGGAVSVFVTNDTDVIIDINGYFAPPGSAGALSLYTLTPCRIADTRGATGAFGGPSLAGNNTRSFAIPSSSCSVPSTAQAYSLNVTVVPSGTLNYLTAWPTGQTQPVVSTLNSLAGKVVANAAVVPAGTGGGVSLFVSNTTDVILDINAYFAQ